MKAISTLVLSGLLLLLVSESAHAGSQLGKVTALRVRDYDGLIWVNIEGGPYYDKPTCAKFNDWMIKNENSEVGKRHHAMLLSALAAGTRVQIYGSNTCTRWGDGENIETLELLAN